MNRAFKLFIKDLKSGSRDFILGYILIAPLLIAVILRFFIPNVESSQLTFALSGNVPAELVTTIEEYGAIQYYDTVEDMKKAITGMSDMEGLYITPDNEYLLLQQGNEKITLLSDIIKSYYHNGPLPISFDVKEIGIELSPIASVGGISVILTAITLSGMFLGLSIVEDKEHRTLLSLNVSPMSKWEYVLGKTFMSLFLTLTHTLLTIFICGLGFEHVGKLLFLALISCSLALVFGFLMGVTGKNQMESMATAKMFLLLIGLSIVGAIMLPTSYQPLLYWSPFYWSFKGLYGVVTVDMPWANVLYHSGIVLALCDLVFIVLRKKITQIYS